MNPEFEILGYTLSLYRIFFILWWVIPFVWWYFMLRSFLNVKHKITKLKLIIFLLSIGIFSFVWARLFHIFLHSDTYIKNPSLIYNIDFQWQAIIWWVIFAVLAIYFWSKIIGINTLWTFDRIAIFWWLWLAVWRIWCYLAWCCFWTETDSFLGIKFPLFSPAHKFQVYHNTSSFFESHPVHPTQIYEMIAWVLISAFAIFIYKKYPDRWYAAICSWIIYIIFRISVSGLRAPAQSYSIPSWFYEMIYILLLVFLVVRFIMIKRGDYSSVMKG